MRRARLAEAKLVFLFVEFVVFPPLEQLIPHRGHAVLLNKILAHVPEETTCLAVVSPGMQYVDEGRADAALALELMAQTVAVHAALANARTSERSRPGYVVGVPKMSFFGGDYLVGEQLIITTKVVFHEGPVGRFHGQVLSSGVVRAEGTLTVFEPNGRLEASLK